MLKFPCGCELCREERFRMLKSKRVYIWALFGVLLGLVLLIVSSTLCHADDIDLGIIAQIESTGHPDAYNSHSGAVGLCQITPIVLKEYDRQYSYKHMIEQLYDKDFNKKVAEWYINFKIPAYLRHYHIPDTTCNRLWAYNAGIGKVRKGIIPEETKNYIAKYMRLEKG